MLIMFLIFVKKINTHLKSKILVLLDTFEIDKKYYSLCFYVTTQKRDQFDLENRELKREVIPL